MEKVYIQKEERLRLGKIGNGDKWKREIEKKHIYIGISISKICINVGKI